MKEYHITDLPNNMTRMNLIQIPMRIWKMTRRRQRKRSSYNLVRKGITGDSNRVPKKTKGKRWRMRQNLRTKRTMTMMIVSPAKRMPR
jgi:hypothetical protein